jgi:putative ABC transport system permease protein
VTNEQDMLDTANSVSNLMTLMLTGIGSISLLVGGIGIMNIMLVSVTERTKEIGIRKAIGAKRRDILFQFLIESVLITLIAGLIGIFLGISGTYLLKFVSGIQTLLSGAVVWLSLGFSIAIGLVFGILPAYKASKLNPIEALHFE